MKKILLKLYRLYTIFKFRNLTVRDSMRKIYLDHWWGSKNDNLFFSGRGSYDEHIISPYIESILEFIKSNKIKTIVDLGCGDFNIGSKIYPFVDKYVACDIVPELIEYNKKLYVAENLKFICLDAISEALPDGDILIVRQVFQHLKNSEIQSILNKVGKYKYLVVTEGVPNQDFIPNKDHFHGPDIRLSSNSGIVLHTSPFNLIFEDYYELLRIDDPKDEAIIVTTVYKLGI